MLPSAMEGLKMKQNGLDVAFDVFILIVLMLAASGCEKPPCHMEYRYKNTLQQDINARKVCEGLHGN